MLLTLAELGFRSAKDLLLLGGGPEALELMSELKVAPGLTIADRAKLRLLVGDRAHLAQFEPNPGCDRPGPSAARRQSRRLQHEKSVSAAPVPLILSLGASMGATRLMFAHAGSFVNHTLRAGPIS
eukprot:SAG31_NODE_604_length_13629_cov_11.035994_11_plen_126_part_00